jgi:hypothetical protein
MDEVMDVKPMRARATRWPEHVLLATFLVLLCLVLLMSAVRTRRMENQLIGSDGMGYYVYLRSLVLDHNLDFSNEYTHYLGVAAVSKIPRTPTGMLGDQYPIGSALLWSPFFLLAHGIVLAGRAVGLPLAADGYSDVYQIFIAMGSMVYGFIGLLLSYRLARRYTSAAAALVATLLIWLAGNAICYMIFEPSMAHMNSLFAVALFLYVWHAGRSSLAPQRWLLLGLLAGLMTLVRTQDGLFIIAPAWELAETLWQRRSPLPLKQAVGSALLFGGALFVTLLPQLAVWQILYGQFNVSPYTHTGTFTWYSPHFLEVLFSTRHGLFVWQPIFLAALLGLGWFYRRNRSLTLIFLLCFVGQVFILGSWSIWWLGDAFGMRALINCTLIFVLGLAVLIQKVSTRRTIVWVGALAVFFLIWNGLFLLQYRFRFINLDHALTWRELLLGRLEMPFRLGQIARRLIGR